MGQKQHALRDVYIDIDGEWIGYFLSDDRKSFQVVESNRSGTFSVHCGQIPNDYDHVDRNLFTSGGHFINLFASEFELFTWCKIGAWKQQVPHCSRWQLIHGIRNIVLRSLPCRGNDFGVDNNLLSWGDPDIFDFCFYDKFTTLLIPNQITVCDCLFSDPSPLGGVKALRADTIGFGCCGNRCLHLAGLPNARPDGELELLLTSNIQKHSSDAQADRCESQNSSKGHKPERVVGERFVSFVFFGLGCFAGGLLFMLGSYAAFRHVTAVQTKEEALAKSKAHN